MKTKNLVLITNLHSSSKAMVVENFADEKVKTAIEKLMEIKVKDLKCVSASANYGIYEVTKKYRGLKDEVIKIAGISYEDIEDIIFLQVNYATLYE